MKTNYPQKTNWLPLYAAPKQIIENFFYDHPPQAIVEIMETWLEEALTKSSSIFDEAAEREKLIWFYKHLLRVLNALYYVRDSITKD